MTTLEVLHSITAAIEAYEARPNLERSIKELEEDLAYARMEIEELKDLNLRKQVVIEAHEDRISELNSQVEIQAKQIAELTSNLGVCKNDLSIQLNLSSTYQEDIRALKDRVDILKADKVDLEQRLYDARGYGERLAETLKSIGASIVSAVQVPEVTEEKPFQVSGTVAVLDTASASDTSGSNSELDPVVAEPAGQDLVTNEAPEIEGEKAVEDRPSQEPRHEPFRYW